MKRCRHTDLIKLFFDHGGTGTKAASGIEWCERCGALRVRDIAGGKVGPWRLPGKFGGRALLDYRRAR